MNQAEEIFVKTIIKRELRERWLNRLALDRARTKLLRKLSHNGLSDLDPRFVYDKEALPSEVALAVDKTLNQWKTTNHNELCQIISVGQYDGEFLKLDDVDSCYALTFGAIIIIIPDKLAYYHTERSNLNRQPFYVLFHS
jgi:hypothetical protein